MITLLSNAVTLTGTAAASTDSSIVNGFGQHTLHIIYTPATDSTNALEVTIDLSPDGTNWFPYTGEYSGASGTITEGARVTLSYPSDGTSAQNEPPYFFVGATQRVRVNARETNTPASFGTYSAFLVSSHP